jgi:hypothetical protein
MIFVYFDEWYLKYLYVLFHFIQNKYFFNKEVEKRPTTKELLCDEVGD